MATEITSLFVSAVKLLVLPVCDTVSTSGLYLTVFAIVWHCSTYTWCYLPKLDDDGTGAWNWIGHARKLCRSRWHHVDISSRHQLITTSGSVRHLEFTSAGSVSLLSSHKQLYMCQQFPSFLQLVGGGFGSPPLGTNVTKIGQVPEG